MPFCIYFKVVQFSKFKKICAVIKTLNAAFGIFRQMEDIWAIPMPIP
jgi:hypothetical protein